MKKVLLAFSVVFMLAISQSSTYAAVEDYATVVWEEIGYTTYSGEEESIKVTVTGVVGEQLDGYTVNVADVPVTLLDIYMESTGEEGIYDVYDHENNSETVTLADKVEEYKEKYGKPLTVIPVVEGATITIEQVKKGDDSYGFSGFPGGYEFLDDAKTIVIAGMGQYGSYEIGDNNLPALKDGLEMNDFMLEFPIVFDGSNGMNPMAFVTVSEKKAQELLLAMDTSSADESQQADVDSNPKETATDVEPQETSVDNDTQETTTDNDSQTTTDVTSQETDVNDKFEVTIQLGDTVGLLSVRYYGDYTMINEIYTANKAYFAKTGNRLNKGDKLILPKEPTCIVPIASEIVNVYTVQSGDTLATIASKFYKDGSKYTVIFDANKDKIKKASLIYEGQILAIPVMK